MKTFIQLGLVALTVASLTSCGGNSNNNDTGSSMGAGSTGTDMSGTGTSTAGGMDESTASADDTTISGFVSRTMMGNQMEVQAGQLAQQKATSKEVKAYASQMVTDHSNATKELQRLASQKNIALPTMTTGTDAIANQGSQSGSGRDNITHNTTDAGQTGSNRGSKATGSNNSGAGGSTSATGGTTGGNEAANSTGGTGTSASGGTSSGTGGANSGAGGTSGTSSMATNVETMGHQDKLNRLKQRVGADFDREYMGMMVKDHAKTIKDFEKASTNNDTEIKNFALKMLPTLREHERNARTILANLGS